MYIALVTSQLYYHVLITHTHTRLTALCPEHPGEQVPKR